jgi:phage baseplate assembly protein W
VASNPSREIKMPLQIGPDGGIAYITNEAEQVAQRIRTIVLTAPGERLMHPTFGSDVATLVWEKNDPIVMAEAAVRIEAAIRSWEPDIIIHGVVPRLNMVENPAVALFDVRFSVPPRDSVHSTLVAVGGDLMGTTSV